MKDVNFINAPLFDEIAVKRVYQEVVQQQLMRDYFPERLPKQCQMDRSYFYNVWNSKYPEQVQEIIAHANIQRYTISNEKAEQNAITITDDWQRELDSMPFVSQQKGRMSSLLKMKSKIKIQRKPRVTYEPHESLKRMRLAKSHSQPQSQSTLQTQSQTQSQPERKKVQPKIIEKFDVEMTKK